MNPRLLLLPFALLPFAACAGAPTGVLARWEFTDPAAWRLAADGGPCLELFGPAAYSPPHRSPLGLAILRDAEFGDFELTVGARQTGREYPHRDLCFVFAYRDPAHFAYVHLASRGDDNAHHVMLVDGAPRRPVTIERTTGVVWGDGWHEVVLRRTGAEIEVWFDGAPVMRGAAPPWRGRIGLGSFDDTGRFRDLVVEGS
jgi:hypothetical protein